MATTQPKILCGMTGRLAKLAAAGVFALGASSASATYYFKVKNECSLPLTLFVRIELPWVGWRTVGPIQFHAGERKYLSYGARDLESANGVFYLFVHVQGNPDVVVLQGQADDASDRDYDVFGRTRRFERMYDDWRWYATDVFVDCEELVFDGVPQRRRPAGAANDKPLPKPKKVKLPG